MVLALRKLFKLSFAVALAVGAEADPGDALVVLRHPRGAMNQAPRTDLVERVLQLLARLQVRGVVLREVLEERRAVGEAHGALVTVPRREVVAWQVCGGPARGVGVSDN